MNAASTRTRTRTRARAVTAAGLAVLLLAAGVVAATTPTAAEWEQPFVVHAAIGEQAQGRNIVATVRDVAIAERLVDARWRSDSGGGSDSDRARATASADDTAALRAGTPGSTWVIVDASVAAVHTEVGAILGRAALIVGERTYVASNRPSVFTLTDAALSIEIPTRGTLVFELPGDLLADPATASTARLELAMHADPRLDSMLVIPIDLTKAALLDEVQLEDAQWGERR
ncbi:MAG: hypothetical protein KDB08_04200 [Microthrixaceae bacterium]|nr:hypothetical protein [Microthrixaceae bacterium]